MILRNTELELAVLDQDKPYIGNERRLCIRMEHDNILFIDDLAFENDVTKSIAIRCVIMWAIHEMKINDEFREKVLSLKFGEREKGSLKPMRTFVLGYRVGKALDECREEYRIYNVSAFINYSILYFKNHYE